MPVPATSSADATPPGSDPHPSFPIPGDEARLSSPFLSLPAEASDIVLPIEGRLPGWLRGVLLRNGSGRFEGPGWQARHVFDGLSLLQRFAIMPSEVRWSARFLDSPLSRSVFSGAQTRIRQFGSAATRTWTDMVSTLVAPSYPDNAGVNIVRLGDRVCALTETPYAVEIDPDSLATRGRVRFGDEQTSLAAQLCTAHPQRTPGRSELVNIATTLAGRERSYRLWRLGDGQRRREVIATLPVRQPAYLHSFGLSERFATLAEFPLLLEPLHLLLGDRSYIDSYRWQPQLGTRLRVVARDGGAVVADCQTDACFAFHHLNSWEDGEQLVVDLVAYETPRVIKNFYFDALARSDARLPVGRWLRWRIDRARQTIRSERPFSEGLEFASVADAQRGGRATITVAVGSHDESPGGAFDRLLKFDQRSGRVACWRENDCVCGEPLWVAEPGHPQEDSGVVLVVCHKPTSDRDFLLVLDVQGWVERGRAWLPGHVPFGFHGSFMPC